MDTNLVHQFNEIARINDFNKSTRFNNAYGYGPKGQHSRLQWQRECLSYLLNKNKDEFKEWQQSWLGVEYGGICEDYDCRATSHDEMRDGLPQPMHDLYPCSLDFSECDFTNLQVNKYEFLVPVNFQNSKFKAISSFHKSKFNSNVSFNNAVFEFNVLFTEVDINGVSNFKVVQFNGAANFANAKFRSAAYFEGAKFLSLTDFNTAIFSRNSEFTNVLFQGDSNFRNVVFHGDARFNKSSFKQNSFFSNIAFLDVADFKEATFSGFTDFSDANFKTTAIFSDVNFYNDVNYGGSQFQNETEFSHAIFHKQCRFDIEFGSRILIPSKKRIKTSFASSANFENTVFKKGGHFEDASFKTTPPSFRGVDIGKTRLEFSEEEFFPKSYAGKFNLEGVIRDISFLKRLSDEHGQVDQSLTFNALELRAKRLQLLIQSKRKRERWWSAKRWQARVTYLYDLLSDFGRSFLKPLEAYFCLLTVTYVLALSNAAYNSPKECNGDKYWLFSDLERNVKPCNQAEIDKLKDKLQLSGYRAAAEYSLYRAAGVLDFADNDKQTASVASRLFGQEIEPWYMRIWGVIKAIACTALLFLAALGLRNKYRIK